MVPITNYIYCHINLYKFCNNVNILNKINRNKLMKIIIKLIQTIYKLAIYCIYMAVLTIS